MQTRVINQSDEGSLGSILRGFSITLLISFVAMLLASQFLSESAITMLLIVEVVMIIAAFVIRIRGNNISYAFVYIFSAVSGATLYPVVAFYGSTIGANLVTLALVVTCAMFAGLSIYAYRAKTDFSFLRGFLLASLLGLIVLGIGSIFIPFGPVMNLVYSGFGILVFSGYILYDIGQYRGGIDPREVPLAVLNLYLDFINLFLYVLKFIASIVASRD